MGIIDSLSAGYRFALRRLDLLLIPVLLDLLLWLTPRWGVAPIIERFTAFYEQAAQVALADSDMAGMADLAAGNSLVLESMKNSFNLLTGLVSGSLLHVPSLALTAALPAPATAWQLDSTGAALGLWVLLSLVGLLVGVLYLELAARALPLGAGAKPAGWGALLRAVGRHWLRVLAFVLLVTAALGVVLLPASVVLGLIMLVAPVLGTMVWGLMLGLLLMAFFFLYFVTAAIVLDDLSVMAAIRASAGLVRSRLWQALGFVVLVNVIGAGIPLVLARLAALQPVGTLAAILFNAFVGTGLAVGLLVYYRSHLLRETKALAVEPS